MSDAGTSAAVDPPSAGPLGEFTLIESETFCVSGSTGQIRHGDDQGVFIRDTRVLCRLLLRVGGQEPHPLSSEPVSAGAARFVSWWRADDDLEPDPKVLVERRRVISNSLWEELRVTNHDVDPVTVEVELDAAADFAYIFDVKHGRVPPPVVASARDGGLVFAAPQARQEATLLATPPPDVVDAAGGRMRWTVALAARGSWSTAVQLAFTDSTGTAEPTRTWASQTAAGARPAARVSRWPLPDVRCTDPRVTALAARSATDLASLLVADPADPRDQFLAAGSPWFLTLFGRDCLWAAFMALPLDVGLAGETLRVLARRQGTRHDPATEEAPGKILHEVRHGGLTERSDLPPTYYGSMDATPLFVTLLHEAWRWGLPRSEVEALLPAAERALSWLRDDADADGDGFAEYIRSTERSLANQGWKDSHDGVQFADGRLAAPPIALCEVQGYAYDAALRGAELLDAFARPGAAAWRAWAQRLRERFREAFWVEHPQGRYPALALDGGKRKVDVVASNIAHLPATGILDADEIAAVARRLAVPDMDSGWGLRTMSAASPRFNPLSYHGGSVWPHDTAIAVYNLAVTGQATVAAALARGLVAAAPHFGFRLPELFGGEQRTATGTPLPYPSACRPQAWAAGAGLLVLRAALGLHPDVPNGRIVLRPLWPFPWRQLEIDGLGLAGGRLSLSVSHEHGVHVWQAPEGFDVVVEGAPVAAERPQPMGPLGDGPLTT